MGRVRVISKTCVWYNGKGYFKGSPPFLVDEISEKELVEAGLAVSEARSEPAVKPEPPAQKTVKEKAPEPVASTPDPAPVPDVKPEPINTPVAVPKKRRAKTRAKKKVRKK